MTLEEMISEILKDLKVVKIPLPAKTEEEKEAQKQDKPMPARQLSPLLSINFRLHLHMDETGLLRRLVLVEARSRSERPGGGR